jgi:hypothetical protein
MECLETNAEVVSIINDRHDLRVECYLIIIWSHLLRSMEGVIFVAGTAAARATPYIFVGVVRPLSARDLLQFLFFESAHRIPPFFMFLNVNEHKKKESRIGNDL